MAAKSNVKGRKGNALTLSSKPAAKSSGKRGQIVKAVSTNDLSNNPPCGSKAKPVASGVDGSFNMPINVQSSDSEAFNDSDVDDMTATKTFSRSSSSDLDKVLEKRRVSRHTSILAVASSSKGPDSKPLQDSSEKHINGQPALSSGQKLIASASPAQQPRLIPAPVTDKSTAERVGRRKSLSTPDNKRKNAKSPSSTVSAPSSKKRKTPVMSAAQIEAAQAQLSHNSHVVSEYNRRVKLALDGLLEGLSMVEPVYLEEQGVYRDYCHRRVADLVADLERFRKGRLLDKVEEENALEASRWL